MDTAFCAALAQARAAPADPLAVHDFTIEFEALVAAAEALLATSTTFRIAATRDDDEDRIPTHEGWAADDLRRAVKAARERLNAEGEA